MINFRYHVVSLAAAFVALAVGAVFGTAAANGSTTDVLRRLIDTAHETNDQLRQTTDQLQDEASRKDDYINDTAPAVLRGTLTNRRIVVLATPSGRQQAEGVIEKLEVAGASVFGPIQIHESFFDPKNSMDLLGLTRRSGPMLDTLPSGSSGAETAGALLAAALLGPPSSAEGSAAIAAFAHAGYLAEPKQVDGRSDAAVLVTGAPYVERDSAERNNAIVALAAQLATMGPTVLAGTVSSDGSAMAAVRDDDALNLQLSTVDGVAGAQGQVVTALAVAERVATNRGGHYGTAGDADTLIPSG
ncbi:copper transporter [Asanoa siamensis]|uniref:Copper transporter MctB n=1 Tax=Asanoa siamensis TaxID=926357 RepID=A0ABQ4D536_9ACTN|nr:copper transporter [Asanoa siamensis]GIF78639.1 copper transporter MctB [Asanoa siamensis]